MLNTRYELHDIRDVEAFCERAISRSGITEFGCLDREDLLAECVAFCWRLSLDIGSVRSSFSGYAGDKLKRFIVDWKRSDYRTRWVFKDRVYERPRPKLVSYEAECAAFFDSETGCYTDGGDSESSQLARAIEREHVDSADDRSVDLMRTLRARGGGAARSLDTLGEGPAREAA